MKDLKWLKQLKIKDKFGEILLCDINIYYKVAVVQDSIGIWIDI